MKIITVPDQGVVQDNEYNQRAMLIYVRNDCIIVNYFGRLDYVNTVSAVNVNSTNLQEFKDYLTLTGDSATRIKQSIKDSYRTYLGYQVKLHTLDDGFPETGHTYVFLGHSVLSYDVYSRRADFSMYVAGYNSVWPGATLFRPRFAETKDSHMQLFLWEPINYVNSAVYFISPSASLDLISNENTLIIKKTDNTVIKYDAQSILEEGTSEQYRFFIEPKNHFPYIHITCEDIVKTDSFIKVTITATRKRLDKDSLEATSTDTLINYPIKVYLECSGGYLPINRLELVDGKGEFILYTDKVPVGTILDLKVNGRYVSRLTSKEIKVVE